MRERAKDAVSVREVKAGRKPILEDGASSKIKSKTKPRTRAKQSKAAGVTRWKPSAGSASCCWQRSGPRELLEPAGLL